MSASGPPVGAVAPARGKTRLGRKHLLIGCSILAGSALLLAIGAAALVTVAFTGIKSREAQPHERQLLVSVDDLAGYVDIPGDRARCETCRAKRNLDLTLELEYKYDSDRDPQAADFLFLSSEAEISFSERQARESFNDSIMAYKLEVNLVSGRKLEPRPDLFTLGEDRYAALVTQDGKPIGNLVVARKGKIVHSFLVYGVYFDERKELESLLAKTLRH